MSVPSFFSKTTIIIMNLQVDPIPDTEDYYFRRLSLDDSFTLISLFMVAVHIILWAVTLLFLLPAFKTQDIDDFKDPNFLVTHLNAFYSLLGIHVALSMVINAVGSGAMIQAVVDTHLYLLPSLGRCVKVGVDRFLSILGAASLGLLVSSVGSLFLIFPGVYF